MTILEVVVKIDALSIKRQVLVLTVIVNMVKVGITFQEAIFLVVAALPLDSSKS